MEVTLLSVPGKVPARILLDRLRQKLLTRQRHEQPGFTPKKSTVDRIRSAVRISTAAFALNPPNEALWRCRYLCERTKVRVFRSLVRSVFLYSCETWTLTGELRRLIRSVLCHFADGMTSHFSVLCHLVTDGMTICLMTWYSDSYGLRHVTCMVHERQCLYVHVARLPTEDPAHRILLVEIRGAGLAERAYTCFMVCLRWSPI